MRRGVSRDFFDSQLWREFRSTPVPNGGGAHWFDEFYYHGTLNLLMRTFSRHYSSSALSATIIHTHS
jgi:hypothetical protein